MDKEELIDRIRNLDRVGLKVAKDLELTQGLLLEQKRKNEAIRGSLERLEHKVEQLNAENDRLRLETESTNNYALNKERLLNQQIEHLR